ncbi:MAG: GyrI-like domain-containing protein [Planctomycetota bacterium]
MLRTAPALTVLGLLALAAACAAPSDTSAQVGVDAPAATRTFVPSLPISHPPYDEFHPSWMQRLDQPYVYVDHTGPYTQTGAHIPVLLRELAAQGLEADGPPFCLFFDDPAEAPADELRSRACVPIAGPRSPTAPLEYDVLPSVTVAYAFVSGPYPDVPRAYPHLLAYMESMNWDVDGPIRETYIVPPGSAPSPANLLCEIQVPVRRAD